MQNLIHKYNLTPKPDQIEKNRFFLTYGYTPLNDITVEEIYQAVGDPYVKLVYAKNGVRITNINIWGDSIVVSISKKNYWKSMFYQINHLENQKQLLLAEKELLIEEIQKLRFAMLPNYDPKLII